MELIIEEKPLTPAEQNRLSALETIIRENFLAYVAVGNAILEIRESRLYRTDGGRTWPYRRNLETGDGYCMTNNSRDKANRAVLALAAASSTTVLIGPPDGQAGETASDLEGDRTADPRVHLVEHEGVPLVARSEHDFEREAHP